MTRYSALLAIFLCACCVPDSKAPYRAPVEQVASDAIVQTENMTALQKEVFDALQPQPLGSRSIHQGVYDGLQPIIRHVEALEKKRGQP